MSSCAKSDEAQQIASKKMIDLLISEIFSVYSA
jgi:hypothetical protein